MRCVRTVNYSVLINGAPSTPFSPERGLRQGDPPSPYLFLLCVEAFTTIMRKVENEGSIHGIKLNCTAPAHSHLFFDDDMILFTRVTKEEAGEFKNVIKMFEQALEDKPRQDKVNNCELEH